MQELQEKQKTTAELPSITTMRDVLSRVKGFQSIDNEAGILNLMNLMVEDPFPLNKAIAINEFINELTKIIHQLNDINVTDGRGAAELAQLMQIQAKALLLFKSLTNIWTNAQSDKLTSQDTDQWLAKQSEILKGKKLLSIQGGEQTKEYDQKSLNVKYMDPNERAKHQVFVDNGLLKTFEVVGKGDKRQLTFKNFDTSDMFVENLDTYCLFVVSPEGNLYTCSAPNDKPGEKTLKHSSLLGGGDVYFAGTMKVLNGKLEVITNSSGHYLPDALKTTEIGILLSKARALGRRAALQDDPGFGRTHYVSQNTMKTVILPHRPDNIPEHSTDIPVKPQTATETILSCLRFKKMYQREYQTIKEIDEPLRYYHEHEKGQSPDQNIECLMKIKIAIESARADSSLQDPTRSDQILKIEAEVDKALAHFKDLKKDPEEEQSNAAVLK
ncbi:MAG: hypothetical protein WC627_10870 [Legionella sp.]|jgi:hypothetical protein